MFAIERTPFPIILEQQAVKTYSYCSRFMQMVSFRHDDRMAVTMAQCRPFSKQPTNKEAKAAPNSSTMLALRHFHMR